MRITLLRSLEFRGEDMDLINHYFQRLIQTAAYRQKELGHGNRTCYGRPRPTTPIHELRPLATTSILVGLPPNRFV